MRKNISTNTPSERRVGYSRAVMVDSRVYISGTTSQDENGNTVGETLYEQAVYCFGKIKTVLENEGFSLNDVVKVTAFVIDMKHIEAFDKSFREYFFDVKPACTLVGVKELVKPDLLIEVESIAEKT